MALGELQILKSRAGQLRLASSEKIIEVGFAV
jgi:hypothetical protein